RVFTGGIDLGDGDHVGAVETGGEFGEERRQPGEAMRLMHGDHPPLGPQRLPRRLDDRGDLDRVVAVVVDDGDTPDLTHPGEAPADSGKARKRLTNLIV